MRYIKPPKIMSDAIWRVKEPLLDPSRNWAGEVPCNIQAYIAECGHEEYILDARIFRSALISELLNLNYRG